MKKNNLVSIIIPCYNQAQYLEESVQSAVDQTYPDIEVIIVNDGSSDNTQEVAEDLQKIYPNLIRIIQQKNQGLSEARNNGIRESLGDYILPLDSDDKIAKSMVSKSIKALVHNNADIISTDAQCFGKETYKITPIEFPECNLLYANCWVVCSLYRRNVWVETGGYKKNMEGGYEDWEFWINAYKHGFKFQRYPEILFHYRTKEKSMYTSAKDKDTYLKSKIVMNNPELYPIFQVEEAIINIRKTEELSDLYFFYDKNIPIGEKMWITEVGHYINDHQLEKKQIVQISNQKVGLCTLELFQTSKSLQKLYKKMDVDFLLFYSPIRFEPETLKTSRFAWKENEGIITADGTIFPFVPKNKRENPKKQLIAYQRLLQYQTKAHNLKIENKINLLQKRQEEINQNNNKMKILMGNIQKVAKIPITKNPINKYKAYKALLSTYYKL